MGRKGKPPGDEVPLLDGTPLLDGISSPADLRELPEQQLPLLARELRSDLIRTVSGTGGHLGAGLGTVELTIALHYVFNTPRDRLIWDVGHQTYPHKILTGRRAQMATLRTAGGLSGFTRRSESIHDVFGGGHSSTAMSAGLGAAVARDLSGEDRHVICVVGDGAISAGMAYEAINNAGHLSARMIVILNDNDMSISPPVGAMSSYLSRLISSRPYLTLRTIGRQIARKLPQPLYTRARLTEEYARGMMAGNSLFDELGFYYVGPIDGHNLGHLLPLLRNVRNHRAGGPVLLHVVTRKGRGYPPAEAAVDKFHGVTKFDPMTGVPVPARTPARPAPPSYTSVFGNTLAACARKDRHIIAITAAMASGSGVDIFARAHPDRAFDVGIAEQHAVTFAAGLATEGYRPFVAIYSTFLQRAYDQVVHDVAIQGLPVRFAIDRAGLVGADGPTHAGAFDLVCLCSLPGFVVMAAADEAELARMVVTATLIDDRPCAFRYPRGEGTGIRIPDTPDPLVIGQGRVLREGGDVAFLTLGTRLGEALAAADILAGEGTSATVADARFAKPLDEALILRLAQEHGCMITVEEGAPGGFGAAVMRLLSGRGVLDRGRLRLRTLCLPDRFQEQGVQADMYREAGLDRDSLAACARQLLHKERRVAVPAGPGREPA